MQEAGEIRHIVLVGSLVRDHIHVTQCLAQSFPVRDIAPDELHLGRQVSRLAAMDPGIQTVQNTYLKAFFDKTIYQVASDESRSANHKNTHD